MPKGKGYGSMTGMKSRAVKAAKKAGDAVRLYMTGGSTKKSQKPKYK